MGSSASGQVKYYGSKQVWIQMFSNQAIFIDLISLSVLITDLCYSITLFLTNHLCHCIHP